MSNWYARDVVSRADAEESLRQAEGAQLVAVVRLLRLSAAVGNAGRTSRDDRKIIMRPDPLADQVHFADEREKSAPRDGT